MAKLRIMYVVQSLAKGGAERMVLEISRELMRRDLAEVMIVGLNNKNEYPELSEGISFVHTNICFDLSILGRNNIEISSLLNLIKNFKPDIIHTNCYLQEAPPREIIFKNIAYFTHLHDNMPAFRNLKIKELFSRKRIAESYEKRRLLKKYKQCNNTFIAISKDTESYFKNNLFYCLAKKIVLLPNAIDFNKFFFNQNRSISGCINLVMVGHMADYKNQIFLIEVLAYLHKAKYNVYLTLIGNWSKNGTKIEAKAKELGILSYLSMPGLVENVECKLKDADIYVHSALYEPFGLVMIEAMASGLPVVCLDGKGNRDIIEEGKNGFMVTEPDPELFAGKIIQLIENPRLYSKMSSYGKEFAKKFDIKEYVDQLLELYMQKIFK